MRGSYPDAPFLSRTTASGLAPPTDGLLTLPRSLGIGPARGQPIRIRGSTHDQPRMSPPHTVFLRRGDANQAAHNPTRHACLAQPHPAHTRHAHTKRARTNRSGRATYSAQALGRLPWFAPCLRRSRRLRPRFDMSFSLGLLSRLKHFCTHWPKPPRHRPFAATKVTEKRAAAQASSAHVTPRGRALSQRA